MINPEIAVAQSLSGVWLCDPTNCSSPGSPHHLPELAQTHVHESVMPSSHLILCHPLSSCLQSFPASGSFPMSQLRSKWPMYWDLFQHQPFQWIFRADLLQNGLVGSPCSPRASQESSPAPQFKSISSSVLSLLYGPTLTSVHDYWKTIALTV